MNKMKIRLGIILLLLVCGIFALAQDAGVTPSSPSISICGDGLFTITVDNTGATEITGVIVNAQVPTNYLFVSATPGGSEPSTSGSPPLVTWDNGGTGYTIPAGGSWSETITISPGCDATIGSSLDVTVSYNEGADINASSGGITTLQPNLVLDVTPLVQTLTVGSTATWSVVVRNTGVGDLNNITITATPAAGLTLIDGTPADFPTVPATIATIPPGGSVDLSAIYGNVTASVDSCTDIYMTFNGVYGCGGTDCETVNVEGSVELDYRTPNLDYTFVTTSGGGDVDIPYCGTDTVTIDVTNSGANAGRINDLTIGVLLQPAATPNQIDITNVSGTGDLSSVTYNTGTNQFENIGDLVPGAFGTITFDVSWENVCQPVDCESIIFEPIFTDDCGALFYPPVKELPVTTAPPAPTFTVTKTQTSPAALEVPDEGEFVDYEIEVTLNADATITATADVVDTFPTSFTVVNSGGGTVAGNTITWAGESFTGGVTETYNIRLQADYNGTDCTVVIENSVIVTNSSNVCGVCSLADVTASSPIISDDILTVSKAGPNSLHINGTAETYTITITYDGPLCDYGSGNETPALTVTDTFPIDSASIPQLVPGAPPPGASVVVSSPTITWTINPGTLTKGAPFTLTYSAQMIPSPGPIDPCDCGHVITNSVTATIDPGACITCSETATLGIAIECDDEITAPIDVGKTSDVATQELCECITYTNTIDFNNDLLTWSDIEIVENADNSQLFFGGGNSGTAQFEFNDVSAGTTETLTGTITLGVGFDLGTLGFSTQPETNDTLTITYTICLTSVSTIGDFVSWTDVSIDGYSSQCPADTDFHEGVWITAIERPADLSIAEFCHYFSGECSFVISKCEESTFKLDLDQTNPSYNVVVEVELLDNYSFVAGTTVYSGILAGYVVVPVYDPVASTVTWDLGDIPGAGTGTIEFNVYKDCDDENEIRANVTFEDNCWTSFTDTEPYEAIRSWGGDLLVKKTPEVIYVKDRLNYPTWTMYITNRGSGTAYNVNVIDTLGTGLQYDSHTVTGLNAGPPPATATFTAPPPGPGGDMSWLISYIPPGETVEILLTGEVVECSNRTNSVEAHWGCGSVDGVCFHYCCQDVAPVTSRVEDLSTKVSIIEHSSTPVDFCEDDSTVTIRFQNIGDSNAYDMVLTEALDASFDYVGGSYTVDCAGGGDCSTAFNVVGNSLVWEFDFATSGVAIAPGEIYSITFEVEPGDSPICDYTDGDEINLDLLYYPPCGGSGDHATNRLVTELANPEITVEKTPDIVDTEPPNNVVWTFTLRNTGTYLARYIKLWDTLPTNVDGPGSLTIVPPLSGSGTDVDPWLVPDMNPGDILIYTVTGTANEFCDDNLINTAEVEWGCCTIESDNDGSIVNSIPVMSVDNAVSVTADMTNCGGTIDLTIVNNGSNAYLTASTTDLTFDTPPGYIHDSSVNTTVTSTHVGRVFPSPATPTSGSGTNQINWDNNFFNEGSGGIIYAGETITFTFDIIPDPTLPVPWCRNAPGGTSTMTLNYDDNNICLPPGTTYTTTDTVSITPSYPDFDITKLPLLQIIPSGGSATWTIEVDEVRGEVADGTVYIIDTLGSDYDMSSVTPPNITDATGAVISPVVVGHTITWSGLSFNGGDSITPFTLTASPGAGAMEANLTNDIVVRGVCDDGCVYAEVNATTTNVGYSGITKDITEATATIGEEIHITIDANYFGSASGYTNISITDTLPAGMSYVAGSAVSTPSIPGGDDPSISGQDLVWNIPDATGPTNYVITFRAVINDVDINNDGDTKTNNVSHTYTVNGNTYTEGDSDTVDIIEAFLEVTKDENDPDDIVSAGDTLTYTISVDHAASSNADAFDVVITDVVPDGFTVNVASITPAAASVLNDTPNPGETTIIWNPVDIANGSFFEVDYDVTVDSDVLPDQDLENETHVEWTSLTGSPAEERNGTGSSGGDVWDDYFVDTTDTVTVDTTSTITKTLDGAYTNVMIGHRMTYTITVGLPQATIPTLTVNDDMGAGIYYVTGTASVTFPNGTVSAIAPSNIIGPNDGTAATTLLWDDAAIPSFNNIDASSGSPLVITFDAIVANEANVEGIVAPVTTIDNLASYDYTDFNGTSHNGSDSSRTVTVIEADLSVTKDESDIDDIVAAGDTLTYTIRVEHTGSSTSEAFDVSVTDTIPSGLTYAGGLAGTAGSVPVVVNFTAPDTISFTAANVPLGSYAEVEYNVTVDAGVIPNQALTNSTHLEWTSWPLTPGAPAEERTGTGVGPNDYFRDTTDTVTVEDTSTIDKTLDGAYTEVRIGHRMTYTITVGLPQATIPTLTVNDDMGAGIYYVTGTASVTFPNGTVSAIAPSNIIGPNDGTAATTLLWDHNLVPSFNNIDASSGSPLVITFDAIVANEANVQNGLVIGNSADYEFTDFFGASHTGSDTSRNVTVIEADLTLDKSNSTLGADVAAGDTITYTIRVEHNMGTTTSDAYDVVVTDTIPAGLTYVGGSLAATAGSVALVTDETGAPVISFTAATIPMGSYAEVEYQVTVDTGVIPNQALTNSTHLEWTSWPGTPGAPAEERNGSASSGGDAWNDYFRDTTNTVTVETGATINKTPDGAIRDFTIGVASGVLDVVPYTITVTLPHATIPVLEITDVMGEGIYYQNNSATVTFPNGTTQNINPSLTAGPGDGTAASTYEWSGGSFNGVNASSGGALIITFNAVVADVDQNDDNDLVPNSASYYYTGAAGYTESGSDSAANIRVHVPAFETVKNIVRIEEKNGNPRGALNFAEPGDTITYTYEVNNIGSGTASSVTITDTLPAELTYVTGSTLYNGVPAANPSGANPYTWAIPDIAGGATFTLTFDAVVTTNVLNANLYDNVATVTGQDNLGNTIPTDNSPHIPAPAVDNDTDDTDNALFTAGVPALTVDKEVLDINGVAFGPGNNSIQPGDYVTYRMRVNNVGDGTAYEIRTIDTLPVGIVYGFGTPAPPLTAPNIYSDASWDATSSTAHPAITTAGGPGVNEVIEWYLPTFDVTLVSGDTLEITYRVYVNSDIVEGLVAENYVTGAGLDGSNAAIQTDRSADVPADTDATDDAATTIFTNEPFLVTEKLVTAIDGNAANKTVAVHGSIVDYSYTIENVGLGDAINVNITDTLPLGFEYIAGSANIGDPTTISGRDLIWLNNYTILPGATLTITFQARVTPSAPGGTRINTAVTDGMDRNLQAIIRNGSSITAADTDYDDMDTAEVFVPVNNIELKKDADPTSVKKGGIVRYTVTFRNNRKSTLYNATFTDTMPSGFRYIPGTTLLDGALFDDPSGSNPYTWNIGTVAPETTVVLKYHAVVTQSAKRGINVNTVVLAVADSSGKVEKLTAEAKVSVKGKALKPAGILPGIGGGIPIEVGELPREEIPGEVEEKKKEKKPACCLGVRKLVIRSQDFKNTLPGYPEIYYQTDIAMYGATELFMVKDYLNPLLIVNGIDPEDRYLMTGLYNRIIEKLGEYAQYNLGNVVMKSELGIPFAYSPTILEKVKETGKKPKDVLEQYLLEMAKEAGLDEVPDIEPIFLEYFGSYPYLEDKITKGRLAWEESFMDKNIMPAALGFTLLRTSFQIDKYLKSEDPTDRFFGRLLLAQSMEKTKSAFEELAVTAEFSPPVTYFPHYSRIQIDKGKPGLIYEVVDEVSTLYDHVAMLWGLSKLRSVLIHSTDPKARENIETVDARLKETYKIIEKIHYNKDDKTFSSFHGPSGEASENDNIIKASDLGFTVLALRSVYNDNRDLRLNTEDPKRNITYIADFMLEKLVSKKDGGVYTSYDYSKGQPDTGTRRTLVDNALAIRAFLTAYVITEDRKYREAALAVYDWMVEELWKEEYLIFVDEEEYDYEVILTPQSIGALIAALRELTLNGDQDNIYDYLDKMSYTTERILDQAQLQLYENRFFPWHAPLTLVPEDPNGRSYIKPIITPIRDKDHSRDLAPILIRKMVLNLTPTGAIASGDEPKVYDWKKWKANLRFDTPELIVSTKVDDTFETDVGMYFSSLIYDYRANLKGELPTFNPYFADPDIPHYAAYLSDEVAGFNVKNLTLHSTMGVKLTESDVVKEMAKKRRVSPEKFLKDFVAKRAPKNEKTDKSFAGKMIDKVKGKIGAKERFEDIIYLEYAEGKPYYEERIEEGWLEDEIDDSLYPSSIAQTMIRQIELLEQLKDKEKSEPSDKLVEDTMRLVVVAKHRFLVDLTEKMKEEKRSYIPHEFVFKWDKELKKEVPVVKDKKSDLFDQVSLIWAMALWSKKRDEGLFNEYAEYLGDKKVDEELLNFYVKALIDNHYDKKNGTLITSSVDAVKVGMALDIMTRIVTTLPEGELHDKIMEMIKAQADFIIDKMIDERGVIAVVKPDGTPYDELCEFESIGTHTIPLNALYRTYEVTGDKKYLDTALNVFIKLDEKKWDQQLGLYLSSGTIYDHKGKTKVELSYTNLDLIFTIMLISELQPFMKQEKKILTAYHMITFMNRILEIGSLERYPENDDEKDGVRNRIEKDVYSPQIIRSVKIVVDESPKDGKPCGVFTFLVIMENFCVDEYELTVNNTLTRIRVEDTLAEGFHYVPGSTTINGKHTADPVGRKKLNWYVPSLSYNSRVVLRYQAVADCEIKPGEYENTLDVKSFIYYEGELYQCDELGVHEGVKISDVLWTEREEDENSICLPCNLTE